MSSLRFVDFDNTSDTIITSNIKAYYQPEARKNAQIVENNHIQSNWQYRRYLTYHANEIREANFMEAYNDVNSKPTAKTPLTPQEQSLDNTPPHLHTFGKRPYGTPSSDLKSAYVR
jgi:hypothetical protein